MLAACGGGDERESGGADGSGPVSASGIETLSSSGTGMASESNGGSDDNDDDDEQKLDVGTDKGDLPQACGDADQMGSGGGGEDEIDFSYIWIANSVEGTISKIDTQTMVEEGRYIVRPDAAGNPSRTTVNLSGDVAVANRSGGVTKVFAVTENCPDLNGDGVITTSTGAANVLPWGMDECVAWHTPFTFESQRPVAWGPGEWNPSTCEFDNQKLWTAGANEATGIEVLLLDGETGAEEERVLIPEVTYDFYGIYGAAVDGLGNFWGSNLGGGKLVYVDHETFQHSSWDIPISGYGMTVDSDGYVWVCSQEVARFDPEAETWQTASVGGSGGCMADGEGTLWMASDSLVAVDTATLQVKSTIPIPSYVHGVSIDFHGYVWGVTLQEPFAYRADPTTGTYETFTGLNGPYTYSDMTGFALRNAGSIPPPQG